MLLFNPIFINKRNVVILGEAFDFSYAIIELLIDTNIVNCFEHELIWLLRVTLFLLGILICIAIEGPHWRNCQGQSAQSITHRDFLLVHLSYILRYIIQSKLTNADILVYFQLFLQTGTAFPSKTLMNILAKINQKGQST